LSSDALLNVINDLLDFSKIEAGKTELEASDFNLRDNLETILRTFALRASEKQLELLCVVDPQVPDRVRGDPFRLRQILVNLLGNAIKFTDAGEVVLRVKADEVYAQEGLLYFSVSDTGVGIAPDVLKVIFDPFTQADSSTTRIHGGKLMLIDSQMPGMDGFALIVRIQRLPGTAPTTIMMLNAGGQRGEAARCAELGVSAHLLKPVRPLLLHDTISHTIGGRTDEAARITGCPELTGEPAESLRVLLAEDNAVNRKVATRMLERRGHQVVVTTNGKEALAALQKGSYDLVLMDVQMPEMDGLAATRTIRGLEQGTGFHQQIIALTAHAMIGDRERCLKAGMDGYLTKPLRPQELDQLLASYPQRVARSAQS
jgi:CheY-like chemotaxis protein